MRGHGVTARPSRPQTRRSMVFARHLRAAGDAFRSSRLNSTDAADRTPSTEDWTERKVAGPPAPAPASPAARSAGARGLAVASWVMCTRFRPSAPRAALRVERGRRCDGSEQGPIQVASAASV